MGRTIAAVVPRGGAPLRSSLFCGAAFDGTFIEALIDGRFCSSHSRLRWRRPLVLGLTAATVYNEAALWGCGWACVFNAALLVFARSPDGLTTRRTDARPDGDECTPRPSFCRAVPGVAALMEFGGVLHLDRVQWPERGRPIAPRRPARHAGVRPSLQDSPPS